jgi:hypothetical protein
MPTLQLVGKDKVVNHSFNPFVVGSTPARPTR